MESIVEMFSATSLRDLQRLRVSVTFDSNDHPDFSQLIEAISNRHSLEEIWLEIVSDLSWLKRLARLENLRLLLWSIRENYALDKPNLLFTTRPSYQPQLEMNRANEERDMKLLKTALNTAFEASIKKPEIYTRVLRDNELRDYDPLGFVEGTFSKCRFRKEGWDQLL
jgi:hypothetical protein